MSHLGHIVSTPSYLPSPWSYHCNTYMTLLSHDSHAVKNAIQLRVHFVFIRVLQNPSTEGKLFKLCISVPNLALTYLTLEGQTVY
jgi:hypothetical protein